MIRYVLLSALLVAVQGENNSSYTYNFQIAKLCADLVSGIQSGVDFKLHELSKRMQEECRFTKAAREYAFAIKRADHSDKEECSTEEDKNKLKEFTTVYRSSVKECFTQANCQTGLDGVVDKIVGEIQVVDQQAASDVAACEDDSCKLKVYHNMHGSLDNLYQKHMPDLRIYEDQAIANTQCSTSFLQCMISKNGDNLKAIYVGIAKLQTCFGHMGPPSPHFPGHMHPSPSHAQRPPPPQHHSQSHPEHLHKHHLANAEHTIYVESHDIPHSEHNQHDD